MPDMWYEGADRSQARDHGVRMGRVEKLVLHTTETYSWPGYPSNWPTITYHPWQHAWRQHMPIDGSANALLDSPNTGVRENRDGVVQVEIICYCDLAMGRKYGHSVVDIDDRALRDLAEFIVWLHREWGMATRFTPDWKPYPASYGRGNGVRLSGPEYDAFRGVLGHQHVPSNDHGDPGVLNVRRIQEHVRDLLNPTPPVAPPVPWTKPLWRMTYA